MHFFEFNMSNQLQLQGVPKKMHLLSSFEFLTLGEVFLGVKNNSYLILWEQKKYRVAFSKILSKLTLFVRKRQENL